MRIGVVVPGGTRYNLDVDPAMFGYEIIEQMVEKEILAPENPQKPYSIYFKMKDHRQLNVEETLEANGVEENDALQIEAGGVA